MLDKRQRSGAGEDEEKAEVKRTLSKRYAI
jgi:hypothetical protein